MASGLCCFCASGSVLGYQWRISLCLSDLSELEYLHKSVPRKIARSRVFYLSVEIQESLSEIRPRFGPLHLAPFRNNTNYPLAPVLLRNNFLLVAFSK